MSKRAGLQEVRLRARTNSGVKVLIVQKHWSVRLPPHGMHADGLDSCSVLFPARNKKEGILPLFRAL